MTPFQGVVLTLGFYSAVYASVAVLWAAHSVHHQSQQYKLSTALRQTSSGGMLLLWDRLWANAQVYWALLTDSWRTQRWADKLRVWLMPPGWRPADVAARWPQPAFNLAKVHT